MNPSHPLLQPIVMSAIFTLGGVLIGQGIGWLKWKSETRIEEAKQDLHELELLITALQRRVSQQDQQISAMDEKIGKLRRELADAEERAVQWRRYALALEDDHLKMIGELPLGKRPKN